MNILNSNEFSKYIYYYQFKKLKDNIYFRIHDNICIDILEVIEIENYFTVDLSVYVFLKRKYGVYCIASKNLRALETPLYCRYWWSEQTSANTIIEFLKQYGEIFWKQYDSVDKLIAVIQYIIEHSETRMAGLMERLALYNLYLVKNDFKNMKSLAEQLTV